MNPKGNYPFGSILLTAATSLGAIKPLFLKLRLADGLFLVSIWRSLDFFRLIFPVAVSLNRFFAELFVFIL